LAVVDVPKSKLSQSSFELLVTFGFGFSSVIVNASDGLNLFKITLMYDFIVFWLLMTLHPIESLLFLLS